MGKKKLNTLLLVALFTFALNFFIILPQAKAETLTKLDKTYTNEQVMTYLLDNITLYTSNPINGTTWENFKSTWENETDNVVFFYYYNNNASARYAKTAIFFNGNIKYNTLNTPNTNNLTLINGYRLNSIGSVDTAYYQHLTDFSCAWGSNINNNYLKYYIYKDDDDNWWQYTNNPNISLENIQTGLDFELASTKSITNYQNDGLYWYFQYMYSNTNWLLGTFTNASEFDEVEFKLKNSDTDITIATAYATQSYTHDGMSINNGQLFIDNYKIYLNQRYYLEYTCYKDGEIVDYFAYQIVFMNRNAVITDGSITNIGSGDSYNVQNSTNDIISFLSNTNIPSGDEPTLNDLPSIEVEDSTASFFDWLYNNVINVFTDNTNTNLEIPIYNEVYTIPSNIFVMNIQPFTTFIQTSWWFIIGVPFIKYIRTSIEHLKGGKIPASDDKSDLLGNVL